MALAARTALQETAMDPGIMVLASNGVENARWVQALTGQHEVLELLSRGVSLELSMSRLAGTIESLIEGAYCAISVIEDDGMTLRTIAAPTLSAFYEPPVESLIIGPHSAPCAKAAYRGEPIIVEASATDVLWAEFHARISASGLAACWSHPILDREGLSLGTIALYFDRPRRPQSDECQIVDAVFPLARIAIEHEQRVRALEQADERFASLAANVPGVVYQRVVTPKNEIYYNYISDGARELFGVTAEEILANPQALFDCHGEEYRTTFRQRILAASRDLQMWDVEAPIVTRDGKEKWTHAIARPQRQRDGSVVWNGIILDATRIKQANLDLAASNRAKSEFLANMSHELRTPLNAIIGFSEVISSETFGELGSTKYVDYADDIHASGQHLLEVINDILDIAKVESNTIELNEEALDLGEIIKKCTRLVADKAKGHEIGLIIECADDLPLVLGDQRKIKQVLINLLSNALKFTEQGGTVTVTAHTNCDGELLINVRDTGIGISEGDISKVFQPFVQADSGLDRRFDGTGLGLAISKAMVELHNGDIELESEVGVGTSVSVRLPKDRILSKSP